MAGAVVTSVITALLLFACDRTDRRGAESVAGQHTSPVHVDSILPPEEALRRFRAGVDSVSTLNGPTSRDALVQRFFSAVRKGNRPALESLAINRAEFAYLVFPDSRWGKPPYRQPPDIAWLLFQSNSRSAVTKLLNRAGQYEFRGYVCTVEEHEGSLRLWPECLVHVRQNGHLRDVRLFGTIIEREGRFKFAGFNNDL